MTTYERTWRTERRHLEQYVPERPDGGTKIVAWFVVAPGVLVGVVGLAYLVGQVVRAFVS